MNFVKEFLPPLEITDCTRYSVLTALSILAAISWAAGLVTVLLAVAHRRDIDDWLVILQAAVDLTMSVVPTCFLVVGLVLPEHLVRIQLAFSCAFVFLLVLTVTLIGCASYRCLTGLVAFAQQGDPPGTVPSVPVYGSTTFLLLLAFALPISVTITPLVPSARRYHGVVSVVAVMAALLFTFRSLWESGSLRTILRVTRLLEHVPQNPSEQARMDKALRAHRVVMLRLLTFCVCWTWNVVVYGILAVHAVRVDPANSVNTHAVAVWWYVSFCFGELGPLFGAVITCSTNRCLASGLRQLARKTVLVRLCADEDEREEKIIRRYSFRTSTDRTATITSLTSSTRDTTPCLMEERTQFLNATIPL